ncbi:nucleotidyltransferase family protein [Desulfonatronovibrio magnus]|uniref:nucleotidyltransferase family protein n=1 Tax=Desulfonatronovibrio magnus TaxID=698827 RepID=UPI0005EB5AF2|nr:nucleotidyltransferase domain-containing protein [Desulfonatronovibrio magnus]
MEREHLLTVLREQKPYLRTRFNINKIGLFGSHAKGLADDSSDIDVVVELNSPLGFKFMELCEYLEDVLGGKVDVLTSDGVKQIRLPEIADSIEKETTYV